MFNSPLQSLDRAVRYQVRDRRFRFGELPAFFIAFILLATVHFETESVVAAEPFEDFLKSHCITCHGSEEEKGDIRFDLLSRDFKVGLDSHHWAEAGFKSFLRLISLPRVFVQLESCAFVLQPGPMFTFHVRSIYRIRPPVMRTAFLTPTSFPTTDAKR